MKFIKYELKKIYNIKLILVLALFTMLFYNLYVHSKYFATTNEGADDRLCTILMEKYGTTFPVSERWVLDDLEKKYINQMDQTIAKDAILQKAGITDFEHLKSAGWDEEQNYSQQVQDRIYEVNFSSDSFLVQEIRTVKEYNDNVKYAGLDEKQAEQNAKENARREYGNEDIGKVSDAYYKRMKELYTHDAVSTLSTDALTCVRDDLPFIGLLMLISSVILIVPYQIRERISNVNHLFLTTKTGRRLWSIRLKSTLIASFLISVVQFGIFLIYIHHYGILKYAKCPVYNMRPGDDVWFDINFITYLLLNGLAFTLFILGIIILFFWISRCSINYIVGFAVAVPTLAVFAFLLIHQFKWFLIMQYRPAEVWIPVGIIVAALILTVLLGMVMKKIDLRKDVMV